MYEVNEMLALLHLLPKIFNIIMAFEYTGGNYCFKLPLVAGTDRDNTFPIGSC